MIHERAMELVAALRSGKYNQGQTALRRGDQFCCLGVACDISGLSEWMKCGATYTYGPLGLNAVLTEEVREYYGMYTYAGHNRKDPRNLCLYLMNDGGDSFEEIATYIEMNWEDL